MHTEGGDPETGRGDSATGRRDSGDARLANLLGAVALEGAGALDAATQPVVGQAGAAAAALVTIAAHPKRSIEQLRAPRGGPPSRSSSRRSPKRTGRSSNPCSRSSSRPTPATARTSSAYVACAN